MKRDRDLFGNQRETTSDITIIGENDPEFTDIVLQYDDAEALYSDDSWRLLGRNIANNPHIVTIKISGVRLDDDEVSLIFEALTRTSAETISLSRNAFGLDGVRSMAPSLRNAPNLNKLNLGYNENIGAPGFNLIVEALHGGSIENLDLSHCRIDDITEIQRHTLANLKCLHLCDNRIQNVPALTNHTNLRRLDLGHNNIGNNGCSSIANVLKNNSSSLEYLSLYENHILDDGVEELANSLGSNTQLRSLDLRGNNSPGLKGYNAFLKVLCDVSSMKNTYTSNHTLLQISWPELTGQIYPARRLIRDAIKINVEHYGDLTPAGRDKIIMFQLNSNKRRELSHVHGIENSCNCLFSDIDPILLPDILAFVGKYLDQNEMFLMLTAIVPLLASVVVDRKTVIRDQIKQCTTKMSVLDAEYKRYLAELAEQYDRETSALNAEILRLTEELVALESEEDAEEKLAGGRKRKART